MKAHYLETFEVPEFSDYSRNNNNNNNNSN